MWGAAAAASLLALLLVFGSYYAKWFEREHLSALTPLLAQGREVTEEKVLGSIEHLKNQGVALQQRAWERPDLLPIYGSSELVKRIPDKSSVFFQHYPTGFAVFPVGKAGATSLILLQKIAAMGPVVRGRQVAISLSPSWFLAAEGCRTQVLRGGGGAATPATQCLPPMGAAAYGAAASAAARASRPAS